MAQVYNMDVTDFLDYYQEQPFDTIFLDPPFNQGKSYDGHNDSMSYNDYWTWMYKTCANIRSKSSKGASIFFMQREKNVMEVLDVLKSTGWTFRNLIVWKKKTSAVPMPYGFGKHYQVIAYATNGDKPRVFNKLRIDPPLLPNEKIKRTNGVYVTDVWDDIRELTSGYFAGNEPLRDSDGNREHKQQAPLHLLARIILSTTLEGDLVFDPFAGTGTTLVAAEQLRRLSIGVDKSLNNKELMFRRLVAGREADDISSIRDYYKYTENLDTIWRI